MAMEGISDPAAFVEAAKEMMDVIQAARNEFYDSAHSSGDPSDNSYMSSDAVLYRQCGAVLEKAREAMK